SQYEADQVLLVVSGLYQGRLWFISDGEINLIDEFRFRSKTSNDQESHLRTKTNNESGVIRFGLTKKDDSFENERKYLRVLSIKLKSILKMGDITEIVILAPQTVVWSIKSCVPKDFDHLIELVSVGHYVNWHPVKLLE